MLPSKIMGDGTECQPWPFRSDTATQRARRVAAVYREYLEQADPRLRELADQRMLYFGQTWVIGFQEGQEDTEVVTTPEAARMASVEETTIRQWACTPHPLIPGQKLLPRYRRSGRHMTYLVIHVRAAADIARRIPLKRAAKPLDLDRVTT